MLRDKSILQPDLSYCYFCGKPRQAIHEIYYGTANRQISIKNGFYVALCLEHHNGSNQGVHFDKNRDLFLKRECQKKFEETHTREEFIKLIGKSYI